MSRAELLTMLIEQVQLNQELAERNAELERQLEDRTVAIEESGTLADAMLRLNGVFEAADKAIAEYRSQMKERILAEAARQSTDMMKKAVDKRVDHMAPLSSEAKDSDESIK